MRDAGVIGEAEQGVVLPHWRRVAYSVFEAFGVPVHEPQRFLVAKQLDVVVDVRKGHLATHDQTHRQIGALEGLAVDELILLIVDICEYLSQLPWLKPGIGQRVEWRE